MAGTAGPILGDLPVSNVELSLSCSSLKDLDHFSKSDPVVFVFEKVGKDWTKIGRTEVIMDNLNPEFATTILVQYRFEEIQHLLFQVYDVDDVKHIDNFKKQELIGEMDCQLAQIVTAGQEYRRTLRLRGRARGNIRIIAEEVQDAKYSVNLTLSAAKLDKKDFFGKSDPFVELAKAQEGGSFTVVYRSKPIMKTLHPKWQPFCIDARKLCSGDWERTLRFSVWDWNSSGRHELIGSATASLKDICPERGGKVSELALINEALKRKSKKYSNSGTLHFISVLASPTHSFMDFVKGGCQISLIAAIDFTASNGKPHLPSSLHYNSPYQDNEYVTAIKSVASVLVPYDSDQQIPVFGFGARMRDNSVSHCFPLNGNPQNPEVHGVEGILNVYRYCLGQIELYGPTNFSSILDMAIRYASSGTSQESQQYYLLLIITDGVITDMEKTIDRVVAASKLPLSIVIVGVGSADFTNMETLDADDNPLVDQRGTRMSRDIVQFVPLREFKTRSSMNFSLAKETLAEIPDQFLSYMKTHGIKPNPPPLRKQATMAECLSPGHTTSGQYSYANNGPPYGSGAGAPPYPSGYTQGAPPYPGGPTQGVPPYPAGPTQGVPPYPAGGVQGAPPYPAGPGQASGGGAPYPTGGGGSLGAPSHPTSSTATPYPA